MKKIVINKCFGGFGLSPAAIKEIAERKGTKCYFFEADLRTNKYTPLTIKEAEKAFMFFSYSVANPQDYKLDERDEDGLYKGANERLDQIDVDDSRNNRTDVDLIAVVKMLKEKANGRHAELKIVEIPNNVKYTIEEYDGMEHIAEKHRTWN